MFQLSLTMVGAAVAVTIFLVAKRRKMIESRQDHDITSLDQPIKSSYEAPLLSEPHSRKILNSYWVIFNPGHKLIAHYAAIQYNIEPHIKSIYALGDHTFEGGPVREGIIIRPFNEPEYPPEHLAIHYEGINIDKKLLAAIRSDPGVSSVSFTSHMGKEKEVD
jgi:hypothetical protein